MSNEKPHFIARKFQDFQRQAARGGLGCPLCAPETSFLSQARLKDHAESTHHEIVRDFPDGPGWNNYLAQSKSRTRTVRKPAPDNPIAIAAGSSENDSMKPNADDSQTQSQAIQSPRVSASGTPGVLGYTESFGELSIAGELASSPGRQPGPANPLKRTSADSPTHKESASASRASPHSRRSKVQPGGLLSSKDIDFPRQPSKAKRLFDPQSDSPSFGNTSGKKSGRGELPLLSGTGQSPETELRFNRIKDDALAPQSSNTLATSVDSGSTYPTVPDEHVELEQDPELLLQPETRPISHEQLVVEVKGIYAGLVMVEAKCIDVDDKQAIAAQERDPSKRTKLTSEQWSALIALHKTLLHEHHDFFLASQHPAASPALSKLAAKYSMPARMWRHGIHAFLEVLRHRLPESLDHMLAFIYIAYSMMALLFETVEAFQDTWIECLGDLGRYRMAIEDDDVRDREVWSGVARDWYGKAADRNPRVGRLYHHLAILARPFTIAQLALYCRSLTCATPFESARNSVMTMFTPILEGREIVYQRSNTTEVIFISAHAVLFTGQTLADYDKFVTQLTVGDQFLKFIARAGVKYKEIGVSVGLANIAALYAYNATNKRGVFCSLLRLRIEERRSARDTPLSEGTTAGQSTSGKNLQQVKNLSTYEQEKSLGQLKRALRITFETLSIALRRPSEKNVYPMIHFYMVFLWFLSTVPRAMELIERDVPWNAIVSFVNTLLKQGDLMARLVSSSFPWGAYGNRARPLPEDFVMRGLLHTDDYFPPNWFQNAGIDDEERVLELPSFNAPRVDRIVSCCLKIASLRIWIVFDSNDGKFAETGHVKGLSPWNAVDFLEPMADQVDTDMSGTDDSLQTEESSAQAPPQDLLTAIPNQVAPKKGHPKQARPAHTPKFILKRDTKHELKEDVEMLDPVGLKQEPSSPRAENVNPATEEWLSGGSEQRSYPMKIDPDSGEYEPENFKVFNVLDETKDPTKS